MASWEKQGIISKIVREIAEELDLTPSDVLGVLFAYFKTLDKGIQNVKVKMFKIKGFGTLTVKGYVPKRSNSRYNKYIKHREEVLEKEEQ